MTITNEMLKSLGAVADTAAQQQTTTKTIDLGKVASALIESTAKAMDGEGDAEAKITELEQNVSAIDALLEKAIEDEKGVVTIEVTKSETGTSELAEVFKADVDVVAAGGGGGKPSFPSGVKTGNGSGTDETAAGGGGGKMRAPNPSGEVASDETASGGGAGKSKAPAGVANAGVQDQKPITKGDDESLDDGEWGTDMSPAKPPTTYAERLTKSERPVPARRGARETVNKKYSRARDRAFGRDEGDRSLS